MSIASVDAHSTAAHSAAAPTRSRSLNSRLLTVPLLVVSAALAACSDASPVAPEPGTDTALPMTTVSPALVAMVDDATSRLLADVPPDAPVREAFAALRQALVAQHSSAAMAAVRDAQLALEFSAGTTLPDVADRDALQVPLGVVRLYLNAEAR